MQPSREDFYYFSSISSRWMDNGIYGHVNNVVCYSFFDSVANSFLIERAGLDIHNAPIINLVALPTVNTVHLLPFQR
jgi:acyl-CoA thioester hydrolase